MASSPKQSKKTATLNTPLGQDKLVITRFIGEEAINDLFEYTIEAVSDDPAIDFDQAIGRLCSVTIKTPKDKERAFAGILTDAEWAGVHAGRQGFTLVLRPWIWMLGHTANCRIFEQMSVTDIIEQVLTDAKSPDFRLQFTGSYPTLEYCVQYRESDLAFIRRLMEEVGLYFYFEHAKDRHTLVITDALSTHRPVPDLSSIPFIDIVETGYIEEQHLFTWSSGRRYTTGRVAFNEYDYKKPNANMLVDAAKPGAYEKGDAEIYDYPGRYEETDDGKTKAEVTLQARQSLDRRRRATGDAPGLVPGGLVTLRKHPLGSENIEYLVLSCRHEFGEQSYRSGSEGALGYEGLYEFARADRPYKAPQVTAKPRIPGPQTAKVVGADGEDIDVDEQGRIVVQFYWERDKKWSRRVRVAQVWSGRNWGGIVIPRIGMEVVVQFLEGDPDQPLVIGTVYNDENKPPYDLPSQQNIAGIKSESTKGGGGYNEFIFDDSKGSEKIGMHAERDLDVVVEHGDDLLQVKEGDRDAKIDRGDDRLKIAMGSRSCEISMGNDTLDIKMGNRTTKLDLGADKTEALQSITLKVMSSKLTIDPTGVTIEGPMIQLKGTALVKTQAPMNMVNGDAMVIVKGGLVMIN